MMTIKSESLFSTYLWVAWGLTLLPFASLTLWWFGSIFSRVGSPIAWLDPYADILIAVYWFSNLALVLLVFFAALGFGSHLTILQWRIQQLEKDLVTTRGNSN